MLWYLEDRFDCLSSIRIIYRKSKIYIVNQSQQNKYKNSEGDFVSRKKKPIPQQPTDIQASIATYYINTLAAGLDRECIEFFRRKWKQKASGISFGTDFILQYNTSSAWNRAFAIYLFSQKARRLYTI
jgi:hypothetical protein